LNSGCQLSATQPISGGEAAVGGDIAHASDVTSHDTVMCFNGQNYRIFPLVVDGGDHNAESISSRRSLKTKKTKSLLFQLHPIENLDVLSCGIVVQQNKTSPIPHHPSPPLASFISPKIYPHKRKSSEFAGASIDA
jgi:hypothetical protein